MVAMCALFATPMHAREITAARYVEPTTTYGHGAVANGEYAGLEVQFDDGTKNVIRWKDAVYEDTAPRLYDIDGDGAPEVVTVLSGLQVGAMVQILGLVDDRLKPLGQTAAIGQRHRWLAIAGLADFDGDGAVDVAYVDRPHLAKTLRLVSIKPTDTGVSLTPFAALKGLSNHKYGAPEIEGGVRLCSGHAPVVITADADWENVMETSWQAGALRTRAIGPYSGAQSLAAALTCP